MDSCSAKSFCKKMDKYQKAYYKSLLSVPVTCCNARAGSGKTTIAVLAGLQLLEEGKVDKIVYIRFPDPMLQSLGALPGEMDEKEVYYMKPFMDACSQFGVTQGIFENMMARESIIMCTNIAMRGVNIRDSFVIIDEAQNGTFKDLKLVLTRLNEACRTALIGQSEQCDNSKAGIENAFNAYIKHMTKKPFANETPLLINHRGKISDWADRLMMDSNGEYYVYTEE